VGSIFKAKINSEAKFRSADHGVRFLQPGKKYEKYMDYEEDLNGKMMTAEEISPSGSKSKYNVMAALQLWKTNSDGQL